MVSGKNKSGVDLLIAFFGNRYDEAADFVERAMRARREQRRNLQLQKEVAVSGALGGMLALPLHQAAAFGLLPVTFSWMIVAPFAAVGAILAILVYQFRNNDVLLGQPERLCCNTIGYLEAGLSLSRICEAHARSLDRDGGDARSDPRFTTPSARLAYKINALHTIKTDLSGRIARSRQVSLLSVGILSLLATISSILAR